jgi:hypothetical protein
MREAKAKREGRDARQVSRNRCLRRGVGCSRLPELCVLWQAIAVESVGARDIGLAGRGQGGVHWGDRVGGVASSCQVVPGAPAAGRGGAAAELRGAAGPASAGLSSTDRVVSAVQIGLCLLPGEEELRQSFEELLALLAPADSVDKADIETLKREVFGPRTFYVTETLSAADLDGSMGVLVRGNLRASPETVFAEVERGVERLFGEGRSWSVCLPISAAAAARRAAVW